MGFIDSIKSLFAQNKVSDQGIVISSDKPYVVNTNEHEQTYYKTFLEPLTLCSDACLKVPFKLMCKEDGIFCLQIYLPDKETTGRIEEAKNKGCFIGTMSLWFWLDNDDFIIFVTDEIDSEIDNDRLITSYFIDFGGSMFYSGIGKLHDTMSTDEASRFVMEKLISHNIVMIQPYLFVTTEKEPVECRKVMVRSKTKAAMKKAYQSLLKYRRK